MIIVSAPFRWGDCFVFDEASLRDAGQEGVSCPTLCSRWSLSMGLLRFSLFEAVEKLVQYLTGAFLLPFEMAGGGMALRDILVVKVQAITFDTTIPLAVWIV